jgi:ribulose 1,5-bisphosphate synthetase/thiazole synthase
MRHDRASALKRTVPGATALGTVLFAMRDHPHTFDVIIAGAGPAGASAAIHLARNDLRVLLVEQKKFPRAKLCG